jgi:hypothetical protein
MSHERVGVVGKEELNPRGVFSDHHGSKGAKEVAIQNGGVL